MREKEGERREREKEFTCKQELIRMNPMEERTKEESWREIEKEELQRLRQRE